VTATAALRNGLLEVWRRPRLVGGLFALNVLWAVVATWPFYAQLRRVTGRSTYADVLARGLQFDVLVEVLRLQPGVGTAAVSGVLVGLLLWVAVSWFLTAGVLGVLREAPPAGSLRPFVAAALGRWQAMARLQLLSLVPYAAAAVLLGGLGAFAGWLGSRAASPWAVVWAALGGALPGLTAWLWVTTAVDVARARAVVEDEPRVVRLLWTALRQVPRWPWRYVAVQLVGAVLWLGAGLLYLVLGRRSAFAFAGGLLLLMLLREALVLVRIAVRVGVLGGTLALAASDDR
jgi:hypothetical protein